MRNGNVYKKFCAIMIVLGLILCGGQLAYAHNPTLESWKTAAKYCPESKVLQILINYFMEDIENHKSLGQDEEAEESKYDMLNTTLKVAEAAKWLYPPEKAAKNFENEQRCWTQLAALYAKYGHNNEAKAFKANAAIAMANREAAALKKAAAAKTDAAWARAKKATRIAENDNTPENFENAAKCWDEAAALYEEAGYPANALNAKAEAAQARAQQAEKIAENDETPEGFEKAAKRWDKAAALFEETGCPITAALTKANAAQLRAKKADKIAKNDKTVDNYINLVTCWEQTSELFKAAGNTTKAKTAIINAVLAREGLQKALDNLKK